MRTIQAALIIEEASKLCDATGASLVVVGDLNAIRFVRHFSEERYSPEFIAKVAFGDGWKSALDGVANTRVSA